MKLAALVEVQGGADAGRALPQLNLTLAYSADEKEKDRISVSLEQPPKCLEAVLQEAMREFMERVHGDGIRWAGIRILWLD